MQGDLLRIYHCADPQSHRARGLPHLNCRSTPWGSSCVPTLCGEAIPLSQDAASYPSMLIGKLLDIHDKPVASMPTTREVVFLERNR